MPRVATLAQHHAAGLSSVFGAEFRNAAGGLAFKRLKSNTELPLFTLDRIRGILRAAATMTFKEAFHD